MITDRSPTIYEMRRVAKYMSEQMGLHSAAGKLLAIAGMHEEAVGTLLKANEGLQKKLARFEEEEKGK